LFYVIRPESAVFVAATNGQTWTSSQYVRLVGGSLANLIRINNVIQYSNSGGVPLQYGVGDITPTSAALNTQRFMRTTAATNASTAFVVGYVQIEANSGAAIDITLRIGLPQLELGAFATSVIPTTTTALTRAADVASVNTLSPWYNASEGTLFAEAQWFGLTANDYYMAFNDGTSNNVLGIGINSAGNFRFVAIVGGSTEASIISGAATINTTFKHAGAYELNNYAATANGASPNQDTTANVPSGISSMSLNSSLGTTNQLNGYLRRITYYPRKLSSAELQAITA
jgi:hypothetical protein